MLNATCLHIKCCDMKEIYRPCDCIKNIQSAGNSIDTGF